MAWEIDSSVEHGFFRVKATGWLDGEQIKQLAEEVAATARDRQISSFLVDACEVFPNLGVHDINELAVSLSEKDQSQDHKIAVLYDPSSPRAGDFSFFSAIASLNGVNVKAFTEADHAHAWVAPRNC